MYFSGYLSLNTLRFHQPRILIGRIKRAWNFLGKFVIQLYYFSWKTCLSLFCIILGDIYDTQRFSCPGYNIHVKPNPILYKRLLLFSAFFMTVFISLNVVPYACTRLYFRPDLNQWRKQETWYTFGLTKSDLTKVCFCELCLVLINNTPVVLEYNITPLHISLRYF